MGRWKVGGIGGFSVWVRWAEEKKAGRLCWGRGGVGEGGGGGRGLDGEVLGGGKEWRVWGENGILGGMMEDLWSSMPCGAEGTEDEGRGGEDRGDAGEKGGGGVNRDQ